MTTEYIKPIWLRQAFLLPTSTDPNDYGSGSRRRYANSAAFKFTNASIGGNFAINPLPQYTRYCDIRQAGKGRAYEDRYSGQGRYYSEAHDDTKQEIIMSFGTPKFSSWTGFLSNFYDRSAASLANSGYCSELWYNLGNSSMLFITLPLQPFILGITGVSRVFDFLTKSSPSKWFYFKPSMHAYWNAVSTIANDMAINMGITPRVYDGDQSALAKPGDRLTAADLQPFKDRFPSFFRYDGGFDIMSISNRAQRMADEAQIAERQLMEKATTVKELKKIIDDSLKTPVLDKSPGMSTKTYFEKHINAMKGDANSEGVIDNDNFSSWSDTEDWYKFITASQRDGAQFITIRADYNGEVSENFSNSTREVGMVSTLNTKVSEGRSAQYNFMGGNITEPVGAIVGAVKSWVVGALDAVNLGGLESLTGTAFIDVPEHWESSMATLPSATYTVNLSCPYGNKLSRFMYIMVPLAMLLPMVLPRAAGRSAYTSPFICQIFHKGRVQRQLGICSDFSIRRGTGNVGWNADGEMLNCEVSFTIKDLSKLLYMPIKAGFSSDNWAEMVAKGGANLIGEAINGVEGQATAAALTDGAVWDEQSMFQDYMATLTSMPWSDFYYVGNRLNLNISKSVTHFNTWRSPSNIGSFFLDTDVIRTVSAFAQTSERF